MFCIFNEESIEATLDAIKETDLSVQGQRFGITTTISIPDFIEDDDGNLGIEISKLLGIFQAIDSDLLDLSDGTFRCMIAFAIKSAIDEYGPAKPIIKYFIDTHKAMFTE